MSSAIAMNPIIGKRGVYTRIERKYDEATREMVEVSRKLFRGTIIALIATGSNNYPAIVMLFDDGSMVSHDLSTVTVEGERVERL